MRKYWKTLTEKRELNTILFLILRYMQNLYFKWCVINLRKRSHNSENRLQNLKFGLTYIW